ncbi:hypothetical protein Pla22_28360 [Rubripirellula amarantea]|uniref:Uncharacterized protein n=1 Tax=Rubripirellula amarantea TaxID=2527999 RepID=A0A5C5WYM5_9BACT|nr:hypothetical protein Pla22_28360 [Rubripirellula amarantea]
MLAEIRMLEGIESFSNPCTDPTLMCYLVVYPGKIKFGYVLSVRLIRSLLLLLREISAWASATLVSRQPAASIV